MKLGWRILIFLVGAGVLFFAWHKSHNELVSVQNSGNSAPVGSSEILIVIGAFVILMALAPSQETLGRWMSLKKPKKARQAQFRRRR